MAGAHHVADERIALLADLAAFGRGIGQVEVDLGRLGDAEFFIPVHQHGTVGVEHLALHGAQAHVLVRQLHCGAQAGLAVHDVGQLVLHGLQLADGAKARMFCTDDA